MIVASIWHLGSDVWTAIATWMAAIVAVVAAGVGLRQLHEARTIRLEESQPYVVVTIDQSGRGDPYFDLVIRNTGKTPARAVKVSFDQPLASAHLQHTKYSPLKTPEEIPILVPGQEWRTYWDWSGQRAKVANLPARYTATVHFQDLQKRNYGPFQFELDWGVIEMRAALTVKTLHDGMHALTEIAESVDRLTP